MFKLQTKPTTQHEHTTKQYWESRAQHFLQIDLAYVNRGTNWNNFIEQNMALVFIYFSEGSNSFKPLYMITIRKHNILRAFAE